MKTIEVDGIKVRIQIWDTAGQERYQTITKQYYRRAQGIFLVYDISSERSYQHIVKWASDVDEVGVHEGRSGGSPAVGPPGSPHPSPTVLHTADGAGAAGAPQGAGRAAGAAPRPHPGPAGGG
uniref:small monomeric GTPase n=1 Tax=Zonotrichia albicollis TaxID=44394 RepID=A0A8D2MI36_ZONAL